MDLKRQKEAKPSLGVPEDGPQTPKKRQNRRLRCQQMDRKRPKKAKPPSWGAGGWTAEDGGGRTQTQGGGGVLLGEKAADSNWEGG